MNLPAHDIIKHLPVQAQHHKHVKHKPRKHNPLYVIAWCCLSVARRNHNADRLAKPDFKPLGMYHTSPGATHLQSLLYDSSRLTEPPLLPRTARFQWPLFGRYRLAACPAPQAPYQ